jgi:hypothetical protein
MILLFHASCHHWNDRHVPPCSAFSVQMGSLKLLFFPQVAWNLGLSSSWDDSHVPLHSAINCDWVMELFSGAGLKLQSS